MVRAVAVPGRAISGGRVKDRLRNGCQRGSRPAEQVSPTGRCGLPPSSSIAAAGRGEELRPARWKNASNPFQPLSRLASSTEGPDLRGTENRH